jgi:NTE family protein
MADPPVRPIPPDEGKGGPEPGMALCLSGGGYRAMVFHTGALWRLYETGLLRELKRISSVSGGSIAAAQLALAWPRLSFDPAKLREDFVPEVVTPLRNLAGRTVDVWAILLGLLLPGRVSSYVARAYAGHLFGSKTLQDLPDVPRFVINATNVQSGVLWRFMKPAMRDYLVGEVKDPTVTVATAVAASSAFPPVLSPSVLTFAPGAVAPMKGAPLHRAPYTERAVLSDGGVYDNLGLETAWKRYKTILVSDAGGKMPPQERPASLWPLHALRILKVVDSQVRALRKRQVIESYKADPSHPNHRAGAYWGIRSNIAHYNLASALPCPHGRTLALAETPTRLKRMEGGLQERLINWGYAICDAALRAHVNAQLPKPADFPYPRAGV